MFKDVEDFEHGCEKGWSNFRSSEEKFFYSGLLLRFHTNDCYGVSEIGSGDGPGTLNYALAVSYNGSKQLSFVDLMGGSWGYGRAELPVESFYEGRPYTVSRDWLLSNFKYICNVLDIDDVWYCKKFVPVPSHQT